MKKLAKIILASALALVMLTVFFGCEQPVKPADPTEEPVVVTAAPPTEEPTPTPDPDPDIWRAEPIDAPYASAFTVTRTFSKNMVVQRGERIRVWGWADESENGKKVSGEFMGMFAEALIENGEWVITFGAKLEANASLGNNMRIYTDTQEVVFEDVLVGDVYFVMGQSNCAYGMSTHWEYVDKDDADLCGRNTFDDSMPIRINYNSQTISNGNKRGTEQVQKDVKAKTSWKIAKRSSVGSFSAIGYLFAYHYVRMTGGTVPVGMIEIEGNGQPLGAFLPNEVAEAHNTDTYNASKKYYVTTGVNADAGRFMYNEYTYPFEKMALAGILWYQGESDYADREANRYAATYVDYMEYMRGTHNLVNKNFPVYFIEFPTMYTKPATFSGQWAYMDVGKIRGIMGSMVTMSENFFQVQSSDVWADKEFWNSLHPNCKSEQALRAAKIAAAFNGEGGYTLDKASGPIIESVTYSADGKTATIKYKNVGDGLKTIDGSDKVKGFTTVSSKNTLGVNVTGTITGKDTVEVTATSEIAGIAYNVRTTYYFGDQINLCNSEGIPAGSFLMNKEG